MQLDAFQGHDHAMSVDIAARNLGNLTPYVVAPTANSPSAGDSVPLRPTVDRNDIVQGPVTDDINGTPRTAKESRSINTAFIPVINL